MTAAATRMPEASASGYRALQRRRAIATGAAFSALACLAVADLLTGPALLGVGEVLNSLFRPGEGQPVTDVIVRDIRLPMTLMGLLVGVALGAAGVLMQTILANPLASPYTLGFSAGAGFGAALAILTGATLPLLPWLTTPLAALGGASAAAVLVYGFARLRGASADVMVLAGIATLFLFQSLQSLAQYVASPEALQAIVFWLFGSLGKASWTTVPISAAIILAALALTVPNLWMLAAMRFGDDRAAALGVNVGRLRMQTFGIVTLLTAGAVAFVGAIGFVGLAAPHVARMIVGEDQRALLPMSAAVGGVIVLGASVLSKLISPGGVIPIGIVTAAIGVPFLFGLIVRMQRRFW